ncbi:MAG: AAA family ATPase, partial [Candidatus Lokiarchaeota archaeon]|nr:AAA family ATPase [Candidatus Lokiarchaeota archaeon]
DRMYNQMQNILLENLESFEGILIATTNLMDNIDVAFSRRFDLKLKLDIPEMRERRKIWQKLIPHELPLSDDVDLDYLVKSYRFTGGQIKLVITNAAIAASSRPIKSQKVYHSDLIKYAELERKSCFDSNTKMIIGF